MPLTQLGGAAAMSLIRHGRKSIAYPLGEKSMTENYNSFLLGEKCTAENYYAFPLGGIYQGVGGGGGYVVEELLHVPGGGGAASGGLFSRKTHLGFSNDYKLFRQFNCVVCKQLSQDLNFIDCPFVGETKKDNAVMISPFAKNHFAKILVVSYQYPILGKSFCQYVRIGHSAGFVEYGKDLVALIPKPFGDFGAGAFVDQKPHLHGLHNKRHKLCPAKRFARKE